MYDPAVHWLVSGFADAELSTLSVPRDIAEIEIRHCRDVDAGNTCSTTVDLVSRVVTSTVGIGRNQLVLRNQPLLGNQFVLGNQLVLGDGEMYECARQ